MSRENGKVSIEGGDIVLRVDVSEFLSGLSEEAISQIAQSMTFREEVFNAVADRLIDGFTKDSYWQGDREDDIHEKHRMRLLASLPEVEKRVVDLLIRQREQHREEAKSMAAWAWHLSRWAEKTHWREDIPPAMRSESPPRAPSWWNDRASLTEEQVRALYDDAKSAAQAQP
jgi:hypothetical protein